MTWLMLAVLLIYFGAVEIEISIRERSRNNG